ncbi:MAG: DUF3463 domain-containing protein [Nanoarchaeota archaeon]
MHSKQFQEMIRYVRETKKKSTLLLDSDDYLETIETIGPFSCYPTLTPRVDPNGDFSYPCKPLGKAKINLLKEGDYMMALRKLEKKYGPIPKCAGKCYMSCYIVPSQLVTSPLRAVRQFI